MIIDICLYILVILQYIWQTWDHLQVTIGFYSTVACRLGITYILQNIILKWRYKKDEHIIIFWCLVYRKVAYPSIFRLFMKGKFDAYVLWPLAQRVQNWIVDRSKVDIFFECNTLILFLPDKLVKKSELVLCQSLLMQ